MSCIQPSTNVQIWSFGLKRKWISDNRQEFERIPVAESGEFQFWKMRIEEYYAVSFYIEVGGKQLFASYSSENDIVTLEEEGVKNRLFILTATSTGLIRLRTKEHEHRFLKEIDGFVGLDEILPQKIPSPDFGWQITVGKEKPVTGSRTRTVLIQEGVNQWIRDGLYSTDSVNVKQPPINQEWQATFENLKDVYIFTTDSENSTVYVCGVSGAVEVLTEDILKSDGGDRQLQGTPSGSGYILNMEIDGKAQYLKVNSADSILELTDQQRDAVVWTYTIIPDSICEQQEAPESKNEAAKEEPQAHL